MSTDRINMTFGRADVSALETDEDFRRAAKRLLPNALREIGETAGKTSWEQMQKAIKGVPGVKLNRSASTKQKHIREAGSECVRTATAADKKAIEDKIVKLLREAKARTGQE